MPVFDAAGINYRECRESIGGSINADAQWRVQSDTRRLTCLPRLGHQRAVPEWRQQTQHRRLQSPEGWVPQEGQKLEKVKGQMPKPTRCSNNQKNQASNNTAKATARQGHGINAAAEARQRGATPRPS
jgi:hypothetical protein